MVYDCTDEKSFTKAQKWVKDLEEIQESDQISVLIYLVGNKCELIEQSQVSTMQAQEYANKIGA